MLPQYIQKRCWYRVVQFSQPDKNQRTIIGLDHRQHFLCKWTRLPDDNPTDALKVIGELTFTRPGWVQEKIDWQNELSNCKKIT